MDPSLTLGISEKSNLLDANYWGVGVGVAPGSASPL